MPSFSTYSKTQLATCDERLQKVFERVIEIADCRVLIGHRTQAAQDEAYRTGHSSVKFPNSKHNRNPSMAADVAPFPIDWNDRERFTLFAGLVLGIAESMGVRLRWGGDWDRDWLVKDNGFDDLVHFEILE